MHAGSLCKPAVLCGSVENVSIRISGYMSFEHHLMSASAHKYLSCLHNYTLSPSPPLSPSPSPLSPHQIQPTLGTEQWECINWRVGALMYMYVHELMSSDGRRTEVDSSFIYEVLYNIIIL